MPAIGLKARNFCALIRPVLFANMPAEIRRRGFLSLGDDAAARDARQTIINELIKTTPPGSLLYYGYDIAVDLLNVEDQGADLKVQAVTTVWDLLDPFELAHNKGNSGLGGAAG